ncbi:MAG TPA: hypothetical protein VJM34_11240, partial [Novosphingobium sp.]|nr:hypothetical protein [Novosphingobium sp.]
MTGEPHSSRNGEPDRTLAEAFEGALAWWRNAGVDCLFHDEPTSWAAPAPEDAASSRTDASRPAPAPPSSASREVEPEPAPELDRTGWPRELTAFGEWWLTEPALDNGRVADRVAPRGPANAALMIVVPEPEREDRDVLLSGPQGRLLKAILTAMGLEADAVYFASALTRHTPAADWTGTGDGIIGAALRHQVGLAQPRRIVAFGSTILPLLGNDPPQSP